MAAPYSVPRLHRERMCAACGIVHDERFDGLQRWDPDGEEPTITPEDTLLEAGVDNSQQAAYQRKMSALLAKRSKGGA
jgi:hypothetical protein